MTTVNVLIFTGTFDGLIRPAGAYRLATELRKHGYTVQVVDMFLHFTDEPDCINAIVKKFVGPNTLWVGFSSTFFLNRRRAIATGKAQKKTAIQIDESKLQFNTFGIPMTYDETVKLCRTIKIRNKNCKIVYGGAKAHARGAGIADVYIEGYADTSVIEFTKWCEGKNPFFRYTSHPLEVGVTVQHITVDHDLKASTFDFNNSQIIWDESDCINPGEALPIEISRGCIFNCSFCSYPLNGKKKLDFIKEPAVLIEEFTRNYEKFGTTQYIYSDDTHNDSVEKLEILYDQVYSKLPFKINFYTYLRLDLLAAHPHTIDLLKESGLRGAFFGIESLNHASSKVIGKGIRPEKAIETLHYIREKWGTDVVTSAGFIVGLPNETKETARGWLDQITTREFPLNCLHIYPLHIAPLHSSDKIEAKVWKSDMEKNPQKYGYSFDENDDWYNENFTKAEAYETVNHYNEVARQNGKRQISDFILPGMLNIGYKFDDLKGKQLQDIDAWELWRRRRLYTEKHYAAIMKL